MTYKWWGVESLSAPYRTPNITPPTTPDRMPIITPYRTPPTTPDHVLITPPITPSITS